MTVHVLRTVNSNKQTKEYGNGIAFKWGNTIKLNIIAQCTSRKVAVLDMTVAVARTSNPNKQTS